MAIDGLKTSLSGYGPCETIARVLSVIEKLGMTVLARVDHSAAAAKVGMEATRPAVAEEATPSWRAANKVRVQRQSG